MRRSWPTPAIGSIGLSVCYGSESIMRLSASSEGTYYCAWQGLPSELPDPRRKYDRYDNTLSNLLR